MNEKVADLAAGLTGTAEIEVIPGPGEDATTENTEE